MLVTIRRKHSIAQFLSFLSRKMMVRFERVDKREYDVIKPREGWKLLEHPVL